MRHQSRILLASLMFSFALPLSAQQPAVSPAPATPSGPQTAPAVPVAAPTSPDKPAIKDGSDVHLKFAQDISSKTAAEGDTVNLVLDQDIKVGDVVVVKAGAKAVGTIAHSKKAGMIGRAGELNMHLEYLIVGDERMKLRGSKGKEGEGKEGTAVALTVLFGPIGLIKHGKNVEIKEGTPLLAYVDENFSIPPPK